MNGSYYLIGLVFITLLYSANYSFAQEGFEPETYTGVRLAYSLSRVSFDPTVEQDWLPGVGFSLAFSHISQKSLGFYTELNLAQAGWQMKSDTNESYNRRLNYLQFPLLTQINIGNKKSKILIHIGPCFSYLLSESENTNIQSDSLNQPFVGNKVKNKFDYGLCADLGYFQKTGIGSFQFMARFNQSLGSIFESSGNADYRLSMNTIVELSIGYFIEPKILLKKN